MHFVTHLFVNFTLLTTQDLTLLGKPFLFENLLLETIRHFLQGTKVCSQEAVLNAFIELLRVLSQRHKWSFLKITEMYK